MVWIADNGIAFRSTAAASKAWLAKRRPFSSTRVLFALVPVGPLRPRRSASALPPVVPPMAELAPKLDWLAARKDIACSVLVTPCFARSSTLITVTGSADSPEMRRIDEPVTSTRSSCCWAAASVTRPKVQAAIAAAALIAFFWNMEPPGGKMV